MARLGRCIRSAPVDAASRSRRGRPWSAGLVACIVSLAVGLVSCSGGGEEPGEASDEVAVVWAVGDGADGGEEAKRVAATIAQGGLDRLLYLGDVYETGTAEEFETGYEPVYGQFSQVTEPTPGNHEWPLHEEGYDPYWEEINARPQPYSYAFELGGWQILSLNSQGPRDPGSEQVQWLRDEVSAPGTCRAAFWHAPRYSARGKYGDDPSLEPFWSALGEKAAIVINGHEHNMQRFKPINGIVQFVAGAGGHGLYRLEEDKRLAFANDRDYGALRLELEPGVARFRFVAADGRTLDSGTVPCEPLA